MRGDQVENPVVQVLCCKKIQSNDSNTDRYRLLISDGRYMISFAMLASQVTDLVADGSLTNNAVIVVKRYITSKIQSAGKNDKYVQNLSLKESLKKLIAFLFNCLVDEFF